MKKNSGGRARRQQHRLLGRGCPCFFSASPYWATKSLQVEDFGLEPADLVVVRSSGGPTFERRLLSANFCRNRSGLGRIAGRQQLGHAIELFVGRRPRGLLPAGSCPVAAAADPLFTAPPGESGVAIQVVRQQGRAWLRQYTQTIRPALDLGRALQEAFLVAGQRHAGRQEQKRVHRNQHAVEPV